MDHSYILHYGTKRHSGRYPWGSGEHPYQDEEWFRNWNELRKTKSEKEIGEEYGMSLKEARYRHSYGAAAEKAAKIAHAKELRDTRQMSVSAIAKKMGVSESTVNNWLKPGYEETNRGLEDLCDRLEKEIEKKKVIDIGKGCATALNVNQTQFETCIQVLKDRGYYNVQFPVKQFTKAGKPTQMTCLMKPKEEWENMTEKEIKSDAFKTVFNDIGLENVQLPYEVKFNQDDKTVLGTHPPVSIDSKRVLVLHAEDKNPIDGYPGADRDGLIQIRRGVKDLDLGGSLYAQVRIGVDGTHYLKGVAAYADNMPEGIDIIFNTSKSQKTPIMADDPDAKQVLKPMKRSEDGTIDIEDPFGAQIIAGGQSGCINKVNEEGKWGDWTSAKTIASQVLSKQDPSLAKKQLDLAYTKSYKEYSEIMDISNPTVRQKMLNDFADECDKKCVHLKAAAFPGQSVKVLLPLPSAKPNEVYCPQYENGTVLALIRYPHQNKGEIPFVTVNNNIKEGKNYITGAAKDAIGVHPEVAHRLSGADFDGDTVVVIPNNHGNIKNMPEIKSLRGFDPRASWPAYEGMPRCTQEYGYKLMGIATNLLTDMTLQGASEDEIARATKYSQVVIDAHKHNLNHKGAFEEYRIEDLQRKYQKKDNKKGYGGAATLISKSSGEANVPDRKFIGVDKETGEKKYYYTNRRKIDYVDPKTGKKYYKVLGPKQAGYTEDGKLVTTKSTQMMEAFNSGKDATALISKGNYEIEKIYAEYANRTMALANKARKEAVAVEPTPFSKNAEKIYEKEVESLTQKLKDSEVSGSLERQALRIATVIVKQRVASYPDRYDRNTKDGRDHLRKMRNQVINQQRKILGKAKPFDITDREWEAIQAGALHKTTVIDIIDKANQDRVKALALPKADSLPLLNNAKIAHAKAMLNAGFTQADIAAELGVSVSTLNKSLKQ